MNGLDSQPKIVGREHELRELNSYLDKVVKGKGSTLFIAGEAGIGKTRLVNELKDAAQSKGFRVLSGESMFESLTPYMPFLEALRSGGLENLFAEEAPRVEAIYLITDTGLLVKEVLREETGLDPDMFASMLTTVSDFVRDSLSMLSGEEKKGALNTLGYENFRILIESGASANLVVILTGRENEFLIGDMRETLADVDKRFGEVLKDWDGRDESLRGIERLLEQIIKSGKYDGIHYGMEDPKARRNLLFENVSMGLTREAQRKPTLLCIEDLQWADASSLALMHYVSRNARNCKLMVLATYRPEDVSAREKGRAHYLMDTMHLMTREDLLHRIELRRLERNETLDVLTELLGKFDFPEVFKEQLYKETEGNPLFIIEVIKLLMAERLIVKENEEWKLDREPKEIKIPSKVYDVIVRRLERLSTDKRKILEMGAVMGDEFEPSLVSEVMNVKKLEVLEQLRDLEQTHKLLQFSEGKCRFDHTKTKEVLYLEIPQMLRSEYHSIIANHIEETNKDDISDVVEDLAYHYFSCRNSEKGLKYLMRAAENAKKNYAVTEGIRFYLNALDLAGKKEHEGERLDILCNLGELCLKNGELDSCLEYFDQVLRLTEDGGNEPKEIKAYHNIGLVHKRRNSWDDAINSFEKALVVAQNVNDLHEIADNYYDLGYVYERKGDYDKAVKSFGKALVAAVNSGDSIVIAGIYEAFGSLSDLEGDHDDAINHFNKSLEILQKTDNLYKTASVYNDLGISHFLKGEIDKAIEYNEKSIEISKRVGDIRGLGYALLNAAEAYTEKQAFEKATQHLDKAMEIFEKLNEKMMIAAVHRDYGVAYRQRKNWQKSIESFNRAIEIYETQTNAPYYQAYTYYHYGKMHSEKGDRKEARTYLNKALELYERLGMKKDLEKVKKEIERI